MLISLEALAETGSRQLSTRLFEISFDIGGMLFELLESALAGRRFREFGESVFETGNLAFQRHHVGMNIGIDGPLLNQIGPERYELRRQLIRSGGRRPRLAFQISYLGAYCVEVRLQAVDFTGKEFGRLDGASGASVCVLV